MEEFTWAELHGEDFNEYDFTNDSDEVYYPEEHGLKYDPSCNDWY